MNLHSIVRSAIGTVNPHTQAKLLRSIGYTTAADGAQVPRYADARTVSVQMQPLSEGDVKQLDGLNIQGDARVAYLDGQWDGVVRPDGKGGDILVVGTTRWLVVQSMEDWPDWTKLAVVRQL